MSKSIFSLIFVFLCSVAFSQTGNPDLAEEYFKSAKYKKALEEYKLLYASNSNRSTYIEKISSCYFALEEYKNAFVVLREGLEKFDDSLELYVFRGEYLSAFGEHKLAVEDYSVAIDLVKENSRLAEILSFRGVTKSQYRDFEGATTDLEKAFGLDSNNLIVLNNYGVYLDHSKNVKEAIRILKKVVEIDSVFVPAIVNIGFMNQKIKNYHESVEYFNKAIEIDPDQGLCYSNRALSYYYLEEYKKGLKDINKAIELYPLNSYAFWVKAKILLKQGKEKAACGALIEARELDYETTYGSEVNDLLKLHCK